MKITTHSIVKNEDQWIWYAVNSVKDLVSEMLVMDDHSTDHTSKIIRSLHDPKIKLTEVNLTTPADHTRARNRMLEQTTTDWFLLLDGDEVWNRATLISLLARLPSLPKSTIAVAMRTRNCVGDIYHYLPESAGRYNILGRTGHLTIRAYRKVPDYSWQGDYPLEKYADKSGTAVNAKADQLAFFDGYYWHMTHLPRSSSNEQVKGTRLLKTELGIKVNSASEFPEVFSLPRPSFVPSPWGKRGLAKTATAAVITPFKYLKRKLHA